MQAILDPQINDCISKIRLEERPGVDIHSAKLKVILKDGSEFTESCEVAKGDPLRNPISKDDLLAKFWTNVEFSQTVTREKAEALLTLLEKLEDLDSINKIVPLLVV